MPLTNNIIIKLNEITSFVEDKSKLNQTEIDEIKIIFQQLLKNNEYYNVEEIESWFENEGTWNNKDIRSRIANLSHYVQTKFDQFDKFKIISNNDDACNCEN